jgi:hypothetical protein
LQKATDQIARIPMIMLSITFKGVKFIDAKSKVSLGGTSFIKVV